MLFILQRKAKSYNEFLVGKIKENFWNSVVALIGRKYVNDNSFIDLFMHIKQQALGDVSYQIPLKLSNSLI